MHFAFLDESLAGAQRTRNERFTMPGNDPQPTSAAK